MFRVLHAEAPQILHRRPARLRLEKLPKPRWRQIYTLGQNAYWRVVTQRLPHKTNHCCHARIQQWFPKLVGRSSPMPSGLSPPLAFGIFTVRTGRGK